MKNLHQVIDEFSTNGYVIIDDILTDEEIESLNGIINSADATNKTFRKTTDLFAVRQFFKEIPKAVNLVFNDKFNEVLKIFGKDYFVVKSIYFDKPKDSNWFVAWHQDLTISVDKKYEIDGYGPWTIKQNQYAVQPPLSILKDNFTVRIHLDKTTIENGALKVIPASHLGGICRPEKIDWTKSTEHICEVNKGSVMLMKPLLLHASGRTTNNQQRRVIHIEFSRSEISSPLNWAEFVSTEVLH